MTQHEGTIDKLRRERQEVDQQIQVNAGSQREAETALKNELSAVKDRKEQLENDMKAAVRQLKDKERKFGNLENRLKDMEDEQLAKAEQYQDQLKSKQAIF